MNDPVYCYLRGTELGYVLAHDAASAALVAAEELGITCHGRRPDRAVWSGLGGTFNLHVGPHFAGPVLVEEAMLTPRERELYFEGKRREKAESSSSPWRLAPPGRVTWRSGTGRKAASETWPSP